MELQWDCKSNEATKFTGYKPVVKIYADFKSWKSIEVISAMHGGHFRPDKDFHNIQPRWQYEGKKRCIDLDIGYLALKIKEWFTRASNVEQKQEYISITMVLNAIL